MSVVKLSTPKDFLFGKVTKDYAVIITGITENQYLKIEKDYKENPGKVYKAVLATGESANYNKDLLKDVFNSDGDETIVPSFGFFDPRIGNVGKAKGLYSHLKVYDLTLESLGNPKYILCFKHYGVKDYQPVKEITLNFETLKTIEHYGI